MFLKLILNKKFFLFFFFFNVKQHSPDKNNLVTTSKNIYLVDLTRTKDGLGVLYHSIKRYDKAEKYYGEALQAYE